MERAPLQAILASTQTLLLDVAQFLTRHVDTKCTDDGVYDFHTRIHTDLLSIEGHWQQRPSFPLSDLQAATGTALLTTVEDHFILGARPDDDGDNGERGYLPEFPKLCQLLAAKADLDIGQLLARLNFENPEPFLRQRISRNLLKYSEALGVPKEPYGHKDSGVIQEWEGAGILFERMNTVHRALKNGWVCKHEVKHNQHVKMSMGMRCDTRPQKHTLPQKDTSPQKNTSPRKDTSSGKDILSRTDCYATVTSNYDGVWRSVLVHIGAQHKIGPKVLFTEDAKTKSGDSHEVESRDALSMEGICKVFEKVPSCLQLNPGGILELKDQVRPACCTANPLPLMGTSGTQLRGLLKTELKGRLTVALVLAYAYLHLGGSDLWPYSKVFSHLCVSDIDCSGDQAARSLFLTVSSDHAVQQGTLVPETINPGMPSLPILAITILSLASGNLVSWDNVEAEIEGYESKMFGWYITQAVKACLNLDVFKGRDHTIKSNERVRMMFVKKVIKNLQYVLEVGYQANFDHIFSTRCPLEPKAGLNSVGASRIPTRTSTLRETDQVSKVGVSGPKRVANSRLPTPASSGRSSSSKKVDSQSVLAVPKLALRTRHVYTRNRVKDHARVVFGNVFYQGNHYESPPATKP